MPARKPHIFKQGKKLLESWNLDLCDLWGPSKHQKRIPKNPSCTNPFFEPKSGGHLGFFGKILKILFLWGNDTDVHAICLWICFWGQRIHFWHQIWDLTNFTRNGGQKGRFLGQKWIKTLLPVNNRNVHRMSLEIFFVSRKMIFLHML